MGLKLLPKLTYGHIHLTLYSVMWVNLAAQVLSASLAAVLKEYGPPETVETAKLCEMIDAFLIVSMCAALLSIKQNVSYFLHHTDLMMMKAKFDVIFHSNSRLLIQSCRLGTSKPYNSQYLYTDFRHWKPNIFLFQDVKYIWNNSYLNCGCFRKWRMIIAVKFPI